MNIHSMSDSQLYAILSDPESELRDEANEEIEAREADDWSRRTFANEPF